MVVNGLINWNMVNYGVYSQLLDEIAKHDKEKENEQGKNDWKKTSIAPYMKHFSKFIENIRKDKRN